MEKQITEMTKEELVAAYNEIATEQGKPTVADFKNVKEARKAYRDLTTPPKAAKPAKVPADLDALGRGPTQGVGKFAKELIKSGLSNKDVLTKVLEQFPSAKTSMACIGYYRTKLVAEGVITSSRQAAAATPANDSSEQAAA